MIDGGEKEKIGGTSLYRKYMGVPPPPPGVDDAMVLVTWGPDLGANSINVYEYILRTVPIIRRPLHKAPKILHTDVSNATAYGHDFALKYA